VRKDFAHKTSFTLAEDPNLLLYVFEALGVQRMTRRAKVKQDEHGHYLRNGAAAKSGLNSAILKSCWGQTKLFTTDKARRRGKLVMEVPPHHTSQEYAVCSHIHPDNRRSQTEFVCQACGAIDNADHNAAQVIARRGVRLLLSGALAPKTKKRCKITRSKVGADCAEPLPEMAITRAETNVSRNRRKTIVQLSTKQEPPLSRVSSVLEAHASCQS
jgi:putative transposase